MRRILCAAIAFQLTACATVLKTGHEPIAVDSKPAGADAIIECKDGTHATGVTPTHVTIPRTADGCVLSISKHGYATRTVMLERGYNAAYWSNFALLPGLTLAIFLTPTESNEDKAFRFLSGAVGVSGALGFIVDHQNGRGFRHFPDEISETLEPRP